MSKTTKIIAKVLAVLAGLGLILSGFALTAGAQTTTTTTTSSASTTFTIAFARNLTIGSTGADVTALQRWLINKSFSIPAGATGYFGTQTQAAVAAYQAANGITPAAGYFGPITRARVNVPTPSPAPAPVPAPSDKDQDEDEEESDRKPDRDSVKAESSVSRNQAGDAGTFSFEFTIRANDGDIEFEESDIDYDVIGPTNNGTTVNLVRVSGDADEDAGVFTIEEGNDATFSFDVVVTVDTGAENGSYRVHVDRILGVGIDETSASLLLTED